MNENNDGHEKEETKNVSNPLPGSKYDENDDDKKKKR